SSRRRGCTGTTRILLCFPWIFTQSICGVKLGHASDAHSLFLTPRYIITRTAVPAGYQPTAALARSLASSSSRPRNWPRGAFGTRIAASGPRTSHISHHHFSDVRSCRREEGVLGKAWAIVRAWEGRRALMSQP